jgi:THO complex subunit 1
MLLTKRMNKLLSKFEEIQTELEASQPDRKRRYRDIIRTHHEFFFPKYLTSRGLFDLELVDPYFRKQLLTQYLIVSHFLVLCSLQTAEKTVYPNKSLNYSILLSSDQEQW